MTPFEFSLLYNRHIEIEKRPSRKEMEVARLTAYMVVGSFTELKGVTEFYSFPWDEKPKEKTLEEIKKMVADIDATFR